MDTEIMGLLFGRLSGFTAVPALPVAWPNVLFSPPADHRYLRAQFVPNMANRLLINGNGRHQQFGLLQINVYWTKGQGESAPRAAAGAVAAHFPCDLRLRSGHVVVRVTKQPDVRELLVEDAAVQIPVLISWECWA